MNQFKKLIQTVREKYFNTALAISGSDLEGLIRSNNEKKIKQYIDLGFDLNKKTSMGDSLLYAACGWRRLNIIQMLLEAKADPNFKSKWGDTPLLHLCTITSKNEAELSLKIIQLLDKFGVNLEDTNQNQDTVLILMSKDDNDKIVEYFIKRGVNIHHKNLQKLDALDVALNFNCVDSLKKICVNLNDIEEFKIAEEKIVSKNIGFNTLSSSFEELKDMIKKLNRQFILETVLNEKSDPLGNKIDRRNKI